MSAFIGFLAVVALGAIAYLGAMSGTGLKLVFGAFIPYAAVIIFIAGFIYKVIGWARSPVPFSIPTTAGQQWSSVGWVRHDPLDNPKTKTQTVFRMLIEVLLFRSLFRNTTTHVYPEHNRVTHSSAKWLWLFALLFHYAFLTIFLRHFRFFMDPVPFIPIGMVEFLDGMFQIGVPRLYQTDIVILLALGFLLLRRFFDQKVRYISLLSDYFPLFLLLGLVGTGIWMRYFAKTNINAVKEFTMGLVTFSPPSPEAIAPIFFAHIFLLSCLLIYFPFSKLMHMGGVFLSPTRNLPNDTRMRHYENPWNPPKKFHTYEAYEDEFRELMVEAGVPVEKEPEGGASGEETSAEKE